MIAVVSRVQRACVTAQGGVAGEIGPGLLVLLGVAADDAPADADYIVNKIAGLRIFEQDGKMNQSVRDTGGAVLVVSQFTLLGDARRGRRPDFGRAAGAALAQTLYERCVGALRTMGIPTQHGVFGQHMRVDSAGDGPVTILLDSRRSF